MSKTLERRAPHVRQLAEALVRARHKNDVLSAEVCRLRAENGRLRRALATAAVPTARPGRQVAS